MTTPPGTPRFAPSWVISISAAGRQAGQSVARPSGERHLELKRRDDRDDHPTERDPLTSADTRGTGRLPLAPAGDPAELVIHLDGDHAEPARSFLQEVPPDVLYQVSKFLPLAELARLSSTLRLADEVKSVAGEMMRGVRDIGALHEAREALSGRWERLVSHHEQLEQPPEQPPATCNWLKLTTLATLLASSAFTGYLASGDVAVEEPQTRGFLLLDAVLTAALVGIFCRKNISECQKQKQITHTVAALNATEVEMENLQKKTRDAVFLFGAHRLNARAIKADELAKGGASALEKAIARGDVALVVAGTREMLAAHSRLMSHKHETPDLGQVFAQILDDACRHKKVSDADRAFFEGVTAFVSGIVSSPDLSKPSKDRLCLGHPNASFIEAALSNHNYPAAASILLGIVESGAPIATRIWMMASARDSLPRVNAAAAAFGAAHPEWAAELQQRLDTAMAGLPPSLRL